MARPPAVTIWHSPHYYGDQLRHVVCLKGHATETHRGWGRFLGLNHPDRILIGNSHLTTRNQP